jgi:hypothetical protein
MKKRRWLLNEETKRMRKAFPAEIYSALFLLLLCISGCNIAGGGGMFYEPPKKIICDKSWDVTVKFVVIPVDPKEKRGKLVERYKNVTIHIRNSLNGDFLAVPMVIENANPKIGEIYYKTDMKPISCNSDIEYVEYYIDDIFGPNYNRTEAFKVPVSKN